MTTTRAYSWTFKGTVTLLVAQVALCVPLYVNAAAISGDAGVRVLTRPSALGLISVFQVNVAAAQPGTKTINAKPQKKSNSARLSPTAPGETVQPAVFSIAGLPSQTFAIIVPSAGVASSASGTVEFTDFAHNAGYTPTIGAFGSTEFAVGGRMVFTPTSGVSTAPAQAQQAQAHQTPAQKAGLPRPNPFGVQGVQDGFMNVVVSYN